MEEELRRLAAKAGAGADLRHAGEELAGVDAVDVAGEDGAEAGRRAQVGEEGARRGVRRLDRRRAAVGEAGARRVRRAAEERRAAVRVGERLFGEVLLPERVVAEQDRREPSRRLAAERRALRLGNEVVGVVERDEEDAAMDERGERKVVRPRGADAPCALRLVGLVLRRLADVEAELVVARCGEDRTALPGLAPERRRRACSLSTPAVWKL